MHHCGEARTLLLRAGLGCQPSSSTSLPVPLSVQESMTAWCTSVIGFQLWPTWRASPRAPCRQDWTDGALRITFPQPGHPPMSRCATGIPLSNAFLHSPLVLATGCCWRCGGRTTPRSWSSWKPIAWATSSSSTAR